jgi:hypothetical protein
VVRTFTDIKELMGVGIELERVLGQLGKTPHEPLKEEQEYGALESIMENQLTTLNNTFINFFKGTMHDLEAHLLPLCLEDAKSAKEGTIWQPLVRN